MNTEIKGYAPGLAFLLSGVSIICGLGPGLHEFLLAPTSLAPGLHDQSVDDIFSYEFYTYAHEMLVNAIAQF